MIDRRTYLGSGDIAAVVGVSPYSSALDVWARKVGVAAEQEDNAAMRAGRVLERPILRELYAEPRQYTLVFPGTRLGARGHDWIGATPDALVPQRAGGDRAVECKLVGARMMHRWGDEWQGADAVPADVLVQVQWQLLTVGLDVCDVVALLGGTDLRVFEVHHDPQVADDLVRIAETFWRENVLANVPPAVTESGAARARELLRQIYPRQSTRELLDMPDDVRALAEDYLRAQQDSKDADARKDMIAAQLQARIADAGGFKAADLKATWLASERGRIGWKEVAERYRDVAVKLGARGADLDAIEAACEGDPPRVLNVRALKD